MKRKGIMPGGCASCKKVTKRREFALSCLFQQVEIHRGGHAKQEKFRKSARLQKMAKMYVTALKTHKNDCLVEFYTHIFIASLTCPRNRGNQKALRPVIPAVVTSLVENVDVRNKGIRWYQWILVDSLLERESGNVKVFKKHGGEQLIEMYRTKPKKNLYKSVIQSVATSLKKYKKHFPEDSDTEQSSSKNRENGNSLKTNEGDEDRLDEAVVQDETNSVEKANRGSPAEKNTTSAAEREFQEPAEMRNITRKQVYNTTEEPKKSNNSQEREIRRQKALHRINREIARVKLRTVEQELRDEISHILEVRDRKARKNQEREGSKR